ncbi:MAG: biotin-dependent carboxyltransferase family protein, partial [Gaiellaceae bacterium]
LRFAEAAVVAVTGAEAGATIAGRPLERGTAAHVAAGEVLELGVCREGIRAYISVRGGFAVEATLGSRSHDLLTGLGPPPLHDGDVLPVGPEPLQRAARVAAPPRGEPEFTVIPGPRDDWFPATALAALVETPWRVSTTSNRIGTRLEGPSLPRLDRGELLSEGLVTGSIQVTSAGQPILLGPDHPTTGGYPVIAVVVAHDLALAGQLGPGASLRFALSTS